MSPNKRYWWTKASACNPQLISLPVAGTVTPNSPTVAYLWQFGFFLCSPDCQKRPEIGNSYWKCVSRHICSLICGLCKYLIFLILLLHILPILVYDVERPASLVFPAFFCQKKVSKQGWQNNLRKSCKAWIIKGPQILTKVQKEPIYLLNVSLIICPAQNFEFITVVLITAVWPMKVFVGFSNNECTQNTSLPQQNDLGNHFWKFAWLFSIWYLTNKELKRCETAKWS